MKADERLAEMRKLLADHLNATSSENASDCNARAFALAKNGSIAGHIASVMEARQQATLDQLVGAEMYANPELKRTPAEAKVKAGEQFIQYRTTKADYEALAEEARALSRYFFNRAEMLAQEMVRA